MDNISTLITSWYSHERSPWRLQMTWWQVVHHTYKIREDHKRLSDEPFFTQTNFLKTTSASVMSRQTKQVSEDHKYFLYVMSHLEVYKIYCQFCPTYIKTSLIVQFCTFVYCCFSWIWVVFNSFRETNNSHLVLFSGTPEDIFTQTNPIRLYTSSPLF